MKNFFFAFMLIGFVSCSPQNQNPEAIKKEIETHKATIAELQQTIKQLEAKLPENSTNDNVLNVAVEQLKMEEFEHFFEGNGEIEARQDAVITPESNGRIKTIHVQEGQMVSKGQLLVSLNAEVIRNNITELETGLELSKALFEKQKSLWEQKVGTEVQYLQAKNNKESLENKLNTLKSQLSMSSVYAPFSGIVDEIMQKQGEMASPAAPLLHLVNLTHLIVNTEVSESYLARIKKGDKVKIEFAEFPELNTESTIARIGNVINTANRSFKIEINLTNQNGKLKPNMLATVKLRDFYSPKAITVPSLIIKQDTEGYFLYVAENKDGSYVAYKKYIEIGMSANERTIVTKGLTENDKVITEGYNLVTTGTLVNFTE